MTPKILYIYTQTFYLIIYKNKEGPMSSKNASKNTSKNRSNESPIASDKELLNKKRKNEDSLDDEFIDEVFQIQNKISNEELTQMIAEQKKMEEHLREEMEKMNKLKKQIEETNKFKAKKEEFNKERTEFAFKVDFDDNVFDEKRIKGYMAGLVKGKSNGKAKIIDWKVIPNTNFFWFKISEPIVIYEFSRKVQNERFKPFTLYQYRPNYFFEDL